MQLSVIIPVYNGIPTLRRCLQAIRRSKFQGFELLVVDDGSTDGSGTFAATEGARVIATNGRRGPAFARNLGASVATGGVLVFVDADVAIRPDTLERFAALFQSDQGLAAAMGSYDDAPSDAGWISSFKNLMHHYVHQHGSRQASTFWGGLGAMRSEVFRQHRGFDTSYQLPSIEDIELGVRVTQSGQRIVLDPAIQGKHLKTWTLGNLIRTDVFARGIPWTELILKTGHFPNDLNVSRAQRLSLVLAYLLPAALLGSFAISWLAVGAVVLAAMLVAVNWGFYRFLSARRGWLFVAGVFPLHLLYFWYSGVSFVAGGAMHFSKSIRSYGDSKRERCA